MSKSKMLIPLLLTACLLAALPVLAATQNGSMSSSSSSSTMSQSQTAGKVHAFNVGNLIGKTVKDKKGETLGTVEDVVMGTDGRADFVILSHGGFVDIGEKYTAVPYETFMSNLTDSAKINTTGELTANIDKTKLDKGPTFSDKKWDTIKASQNKICSYYGLGQCPHSTS